MLYYENLDEIIFTKEQLVSCDELIILSGYVGPNPIHKLNDLGIKSTVIYGMYGSDGIRKSLHEALLKEHQTSDKVDILYSTIPVHSKCYVWKKNGTVQSALIGSANFSDNGLKTPYREVLADATKDTFQPLNKYLDMVMGGAILCEVAKPKDNLHNVLSENLEEEHIDAKVCVTRLYLERSSGEKYIPASSGLNWGQSTTAHVNRNDAYIAIRSNMIDKYPTLFPRKQEKPLIVDGIVRRDHRHNDSIEIILDDGTVMTGLMEGTFWKIIDGERVAFPKQITSTPNKATLGEYLRKRIGVKSGVQIKYEDLLIYGRDTIDISLQGEGIYYFDFSVK